MSIEKGYQFARYAEVEIKNFMTGEKTVIPNDFEIDFEFLKTIDQVEQASVGVVKIYGLTDETIQRITSDGGEIKLTCGYTNSTVATLFIADILYINSQPESGTVVTEIHCSANVLTHIFGAVLSVGQGMTTISKLANDIGKLIGRKAFFKTTNVPMVSMKNYIEVVQTWGLRVDLFGTPEQLLDIFCLNFDFQFTTDDFSDEALGNQPNIVFSQKANGVTNLLKRSEEGYQKITKQELSVNKLSDENGIEGLFITPESEKATAIVLRKDTGLVSANVGYKMATISETQELSANEKQTENSKIKQSVFNTKQAEKKKKYEDKVAEGKKVKPLKMKTTNIKVNRKVLNFEAQLNPSLRPQGHIVVFPKRVEHRGTYIVRDVKFKGNNKRGQWVMSGTAEDTMGKYDTMYKGDSNVYIEQEEFIGEVGNNNSYGGGIDES